MVTDWPCVFLVSPKRTETMADLFIVIFPAFSMLPDTKCVFNRFVKFNSFIGSIKNFKDIILSINNNILNKRWH